MGWIGLLSLVVPKRKVGRIYDAPFLVYEIHYFLSVRWIVD